MAEPMTILEVVATYKKVKPNGHFFDKNTLAYFGQTLADFKVIETEDPSIIHLEHRTWFNEETPQDVLTEFNMSNGEMNTLMTRNPITNEIIHKDEKIGEHEWLLNMVAA